MSTEALLEAGTANPDESRRWVDVPQHGTFQVRRHVSRVDSFKVDAAGQRVPGWHGWQVRWPGFRRFFTDAQCGGCAQALAAAETFVEKNYPGKRSQCKGEVGVRLVRLEKRNRRLAEFYVEVSHPMAGKSPRRLYVGTEATVTPERVQDKMVQARRLRRDLVRRHKEHTQRW